MYKVPRWIIKVSWENHFHNRERCKSNVVQQYGMRNDADRWCDAGDSEKEQWTTLFVVETSIEHTFKALVLNPLEGAAGFGTKILEAQRKKTCRVYLPTEGKKQKQNCTRSLEYNY
jgi:hypothetical protein